jgi:hypothetical protein
MVQAFRYSSYAIDRIVVDYQGDSGPRLRLPASSILFPRSRGLPTMQAMASSRADSGARDDSAVSARFPRNCQSAIGEEGS